MKFRIDIWHNILWSIYKASVFSELDRQARADELDLRFFQIAETEDMRISLGEVDLSRHAYPYTLVFKGSYESIPALKMMCRIGRLTFRSDAQLVVLSGYSRPENWLQLVILRLRGKKIAVFCDSTVYDRKQTFFKTLLKRVFFKNVDGAFCYGERSREYLRLMGADERKIFTRCQAAALPPDYRTETAIANRVKRAPSPEKPRFLYVGRLSPEKDLPVLFTAFASIAAERRGSLILVGGGAERNRLEALASELGISGAVQFLGSKSPAELVDEYARATCLILPSRSEPWGLVVNEALAQGCPVVVSQACGCQPELVVPGVTGYGFTTGSSTDLAARMEASTTRFRDVEKTARDCVTHISSFSPENAASQITSGIRSIITETKIH